MQPIDFLFIVNFFIVLSFVLYNSIYVNVNIFKYNQEYIPNAYITFARIYAFWGIANIFFYFMSYD